MSKVVIITGASSGLGKATALHLVKQGYKVYGTSRSPKKYLIKEFPLYPLDINKPETMTTFVDKVYQETGRIDVLINNAGVGNTGPVEEISTDAVLANFQTNCFGPIQLAQHILPIMRNQKSGLIINITSIAGGMGLPYRGVYSASKGALELLTESLRMEVKNFGIKVCSIAPGDYATDIASRRYHAPVIENSPYEASYQESLNTMDAHVDQGNDPIEIAEAIIKVMGSKNPKVHYRVGAPLQKIAIFLKAILPDRLFEKLLMKNYNI